jgi:glycosyltransferase involved in cell wall biosynthesis
VSVLIITYNEERNIRYALESVVGWAQEVYVVDSFSSDETTAICAEYAERGVKVVQHTFENYSAQRNWALENIDWQGEWIFWIDADEAVTPELAAELEALFSGGPDKDFYYVKRRFIFLGRWLRHASSYPLWLLRLFKKGQAHFTRPINEQVVVEGQAGYLEHDLLHDDRRGLSAWLAKHNRYTSLEAEQYDAVQRGKGSDTAFLSEEGRPDVRRQRRLRRFIRLPCRPFVMFLYLYIWKRGFLDGRPGLIYCLLKACNQVHLNAKLYELRLERKSDA